MQLNFKTITKLLNKTSQLIRVEGWVNMDNYFRVTLSLIQIL